MISFGNFKNFDCSFYLNSEYKIRYCYFLLFFSDSAFHKKKKYKKTTGTLFYNNLVTDVFKFNRFGFPPLSYTISRFAPIARTPRSDEIFVEFYTNCFLLFAPCCFCPFDSCSRNSKKCNK